MPSFPSKKKAFVLWEYRKGYPIRQRPIYGQQSPRAHWGDYISEGTVWFCSHHTQKALPGCDNIRHSRSNLLLLLPQCLSGNPLFRAAAWHQDLIQMFLSSSLPLHIRGCHWPSALADLEVPPNPWVPFIMAHVTSSLIKVFKNCIWEYGQNLGTRKKSYKLGHRGGWLGEGDGWERFGIFQQQQRKLEINGTISYKFWMKIIFKLESIPSQNIS